MKIGCGFLAAMMAEESVRACACGCGVFDVGTSSMLPSGQGGMAWVQYAFQDQNRNWSGTSQAPAAGNDDKDIATSFVTVGVQYMISRSWGVQVEFPYDARYFKTTDDSGNIVSRAWSGLGDLRVEGIYTGFSEDLSSGVVFGLKLPTGRFNYDADVVDRDSQLGSGSTDALIGGFHRGHLSAEHQLDWFGQLLLDVPMFIQDGYRPGLELDTALGLNYNGLWIGRVGIVPIAQVIFSERTSDSGPNSASPVASGYQRLMLAPGVEIHAHPFRFYADIELPVYQNFTGNQLAASILVKAGFSVMF